MTESPDFSGAGADFDLSLLPPQPPRTAARSRFTTGSTGKSWFDGARDSVAFVSFVPFVLVRGSFEGTGGETNETSTIGIGEAGISSTSLLFPFSFTDGDFFGLVSFDGALSLGVSFFGLSRPSFLGVFGISGFDDPAEVAEGGTTVILGDTGLSVGFSSPEASAEAPGVCFPKAGSEFVR